MRLFTKQPAALGGGKLRGKGAALRFQEMLSSHTPGWALLRMPGLFRLSLQLRISVGSLRYPALAKQEDGRCGLLQRKPTHSILCFYPLSISDLHLVDLLPFAVNGFMSSFISQSKRFVFHMVLWDIQKQVPKTFSTTWLSNVDCSHRGQC